MRHLACALLVALLSLSPALADTFSFPPATRTSGTIGSGATQIPSCSAALKGAMYIVSDALTPVALSTAVGGGAVTVGITCNGTNWIVQ